MAALVAVGQGPAHQGAALLKPLITGLFAALGAVGVALASWLGRLLHWDATRLLRHNLGQHLAGHAERL